MEKPFPGYSGLIDSLLVELWKGQKLAVCIWAKCHIFTTLKYFSRNRFGCGEEIFGKKGALLLFFSNLNVKAGLVNPEDMRQIKQYGATHLQQGERKDACGRLVFFCT